MATVNFRLKTNSDWNTIYVRFKHGSKFDYECATELSVPKGRWSSNKQEVLSTSKINYIDQNIKLNDLKIYILKEYEDSKTNGTILSTQWLKEKVVESLNLISKSNEVNHKIYLVEFIDTFIRKSKTRKTRDNTPVTKRTIQHYETTQRKILSLERKLNTKFKLVDVDLDFHAEFLTHLKEDQYLRNSTIGGYIDDIRLFCRSAENNGINVSNHYKLSDFYSPKYETDDIYLKVDEINKIYATNIENNKLDNARDWLIIGLYTGLRVGDLLNLTLEDIDSDFIYKKTKKTKYPVIIPLHPHIKEILKKRNGHFPRKISDQKFNDYIKQVCKLAGITQIVKGAKMCPKEIQEGNKKKIIHRKEDGEFPKYELVSSHCCRRSFASNLYGKIETLTIMKITGHKTESQFFKYIKITPKEYALKLKDYWKRNKEMFVVE